MIRKINFINFHKVLKKNKNKAIFLKKYPDLWIKTLFKEYPRFKEILLPIPKIKKKDLFLILLKRRSYRKFKKGIISLNNLSALFYFSAGIKNVEISKRKNYSYFFNNRMYPSGGARFPLEVYLVLFKKAENINPGIYHYNVKRHSLILIKRGNFKKFIKDKILSSINKRLINNSLFYVSISAYFGRSFIKYGDASYLLSLMEAGHLGQNFYLVGTALGLGCCGIYGFYEDRANRLLDLNTDVEEVIYSFIFGNI